MFATNIFGLILFAASTLSFHPYIPNEDNVVLDMVAPICHKFAGKIKCMDGSSILPDGYLELWERDVEEDDYQTKMVLGTPSYHVTIDDPQNKTATFIFDYCIVDGFMDPFIEIYYIFKDVCHVGDSIFGTPEIYTLIVYDIIPIEEWRTYAL